MKKRFAIAVVLASTASTVYAVDGNAVIGGALGGGAGAAIGSAVGGREGAIIGGAIGGGAGAAVATSGRQRERETVIVRERERHDNGLHLGHYKRHGRHD
jgi:hypothetical protein